MSVKRNPTLLAGSSLLFHSYHQQEKSKRNIIRLHPLQFIWLAIFLCLSVASTHCCRRENTQTGTERNNANPSPAVDGKQTLVQWIISRILDIRNTRILDRYHRPDMFAAGCLLTFSLHFLETNRLFICWQCFGAADSGHFPEAACITGNRNA